MASPDSADPHYSLSPLGAGDLIDRAVRFYRNNFWTFVVIASPPVIVGTIISVGWTMLSREMFSVGASRYSGDTPFYYLFLWFGSVVIWMTETIATLAVMGGASRNFVRHLLFGESITFRETYRNTWNRLPGLLVASSLIAMALGIFGIMIFYFGALLAVLLIGLIAFVFSFFPLALVILSIVAGVAAAVGAGWLFFLVASRVAYVPQVMLVEGQGVFAAIGRSVSLASGNVTRLAALFIFSTFAAYSALAICMFPLPGTRRLKVFH